MIDYKHVTLTIRDYSGNNVGTLYTPDTNSRNQAYNIQLMHESNGWKELSFSISKTVDGEPNPLMEKLVNEYNIEVDDGNYQDVFTISEPNISHSSAMQVVDVKCNHISSRLRTKKLYLTFDDTNGIGTCTQLMTIILQGTGWTLGEVDGFYEPDGVTERVRTLSSNGKEGAYQLINKVCELFNARPVFHGMTKTVDIRSFAPYHFEGDAQYPTLADADSTIELNYSKGMSGVSRRLNTENLITRLYVEGAFGDDGYVGIENENPSGTNFLLDFGYFQAVGLYTPEHEMAVDNYISTLIPAREAMKEYTNRLSTYQSQLMNLWGIADYSIYSVTSQSTPTTMTVQHVTSLGEDTAITAGDVIMIRLDDGAFIRTKAVTVTGDELEIEKPVPDGMPVTDVLVYRELATGTIGGKEIAVESAQGALDKVIARVGDNLLMESDVAVATDQYMVKQYLLTDDWEPGREYTISLWGTVNAGNTLKAYRDKGQTWAADLEYDSNRRAYIATFIAPETTQTDKNILRIYNYPSATATSASITRIKLEFGNLPTPYSPAENSSNAETIAEYEAKINGLYLGTSESPGIYELTTEAIETAKHCQQLRESIAQAKQDIENAEATFSEQMGDMLRDGYWNDSNYIVGQEAGLYSDAVEIHRTMSRPVSTYDVSMHNVVGIDAAPLLAVSINSPVHIIDEDIDVNAWGYVDQVTYCLDMPYNNTLRVSTEENRFAGKSFTQIISQIAETARDVRDKKGIYARAGLITKAGTVPATSLDGFINVEVTRLLSRTSSWETDSSGNIILTSQDGTSAMMLTGEGFLIADHKKTDGTWDWTTAGTGKGLVADAITAGTLQAGIVKILGTDQFFWDADNIYIFDPTNANRQIRIGRYDGQNYGIGFTQDDGATWVSAFGFDGVNLNYTTIPATNITGLDGMFLTPEQAAEQYATIGTVGAINSTLNDLNSDIRQNIQFTAGGIIIQQTGAAGEGNFNARFTSTALEFYSGMDKMAWFDNKSLNVNILKAGDQLSVGNLVWYVNKADNSVSAKWYGVVPG